MTAAMRKERLAASVGQALRLHQAGELDRAEAIYRAVLAEDPGHGDALHLYGCLLDNRGAIEAAIELVGRATRANREAWPYFGTLGRLCLAGGRPDEAIRHCRSALRLKPDFLPALNNLGAALASTGDHDGAITCYRKAIRLQPGHCDAHFNLGLSLRARGDLEGAVAAYREAIRIRPDHVRAHFNLGNVCDAAHRPSEAVAAYRAALAIDAQDARIHTNLGGVLMRLGRLDEAEHSFREALRLDPSDRPAGSNLVLAASYATDDPCRMRDECAAWARVHAPGEAAPGPAPRDPDPERRLRIGYVSADFRHHAAAYWIEPLLAGHDRNGWEILCYATGSGPDEVTQRLRGQAHGWIECAAEGDEALAERIRADGIDILVDLSGHTEGNRLPVFARKPAPIQVSWLGFPGSTGLSAVDYRFTDPVMDPEGEADAFYAEKLVRLPRFYAAFRPHPGTPDPALLPAQRNGFVTFVSFNNLAKITPAMLDLWGRILRDLPSARLLIQAAGLDDPACVAPIAAHFERAGVGAQRLDFRGWCGIEDYLAIGQSADIALDPFPFNGGVTTCHALWMGLPVVTRSGRSAASRVGQSLLGQCGLSELVAEDEAGYHRIATGLALDVPRLAGLRAGLRDRMQASGLLDGLSLARAVEHEYRRMWRTRCAQHPARSGSAEAPGSSAS